VLAHSSATGTITAAAPLSAPTINDIFSFSLSSFQLHAAAINYCFFIIWNIMITMSWKKHFIESHW